MKSIITQHITTSSAGMPIDRETLDWLQSAPKEIMLSYLRNRIGNPAVGKLYILDVKQSSITYTSGIISSIALGESCVGYKDGELLIVNANTYNSSNNAYLIETKISKQYTNLTQYESLSDRYVNASPGVPTGGTLVPFGDIIPVVQYSTVVLPIGSWDMTSEARKSIPHGLVSARIRSMSVVIFSDTNTAYQFNESTGTAGIYGEAKILANTTNVIIDRADAGQFNDSSFNDPNPNRGYVTIMYST